MKKISQLFNIQYGNSFDLQSMVPCEKEDKNAVNFVCRSSKNNGIAAIVEKIAWTEPFQAGLLTVAVGGSVLETFIQTEPFYTGYHVLILEPKNNLSIIQKLFYCMCIRANKYKYNYGRQANRTLGDILVPDLNEIPSDFMHMHVPDYSSMDDKFITGEIDFDVRKWKIFRYDEVFDIKKGYYNKKPEHTISGNIPFIGAIDHNNGVSELYSIEDISLYHKDGSTDSDDLNKKLFDGNCITVSNNGSVGYAFYQKDKFTCSHDVNPLYLKENKDRLNPYIAMFLISLIEKERFRWCYGRKWRPKRMPSSLINLPVDKEGNPDWDYMEKFIKSMPYSKSI